MRFKVTETGSERCPFSFAQCLSEAVRDRLDRAFLRSRTIGQTWTASASFLKGAACQAWSTSLRP